MSSLSPLKNESLLLVFTYAPAGLGHLRMANTLYQGLPDAEELNTILFGSHDRLIESLHRFISVHPFTRALMEWVQRGWPQDVFTSFYRSLLRWRTKTLYHQLSLLLEQKISTTKTVLVIATHFGLAHQLAGIKEKLGQERGIKVILVVQVTDDTPQHLWYIQGADLIFVPSQKTKNMLLEYVRLSNLPQVNFVTRAYPINPLLTKKLNQTAFKNRVEQTLIEKTKPTNIAIPVSGAAVWMDFFRLLIESLNSKKANCLFHVVSKDTPHTYPFLEKMRKTKNTSLYVSFEDKEVVKSYDELYSSVPIAFEITKPSEQAFKALLTPKMVGGSILLFSKPVGRQERDNLDFLKRHQLIPSETEQNLLFELSYQDQALSSSQAKDLQTKALGWRGLCLPDSPQKASSFIIWGLKKKLFSQMMNYQKPAKPSPEVGQQGVKEFWEKVAEILPD
ncbi:MAG TPA: hypothetical protein VMW25_05840 [Clostridia bacterium]|nr:hypothetical protein [Clostridia bacterium]